MNLHIDADPEKSAYQLYMDICKNGKKPSRGLSEQLKMLCEDAYKRLLEPSITRDVLKEAKEKADHFEINMNKLYQDYLRSNYLK